MSLLCKFYEYDCLSNKKIGVANHIYSWHIKIYNLSERAIWVVKPAKKRLSTVFSLVANLNCVPFRHDSSNLRVTSPKERKTTSRMGCRFSLEAPPRFELGDKGFADPCLTTWLWRRFFQCSNIIAKHF